MTAIAGSVSSACTRNRGGAQLVIAMPSERLAALTIDAGISLAVLVLPLTVLSDGGREVEAAVAGVVVATVYLALPLARRGRTVGQSLLGLTVLDEETGRPVSNLRAVLRSLIVVLEVVGIPTMIFAGPAVLEYLAASRSGRSLTDRGTAHGRDVAPRDAHLPPVRTGRSVTLALPARFAEMSADAAEPVPAGLT